MLKRVLRRFLVAGFAVQLLAIAVASNAAAGTFPVIICGSSARTPGDGLTWSSNAPLSAGPTCPSAGLGLSIYASNGKTAARNATGAFKVTAPSGVTVYSIHVVHASSGGMGVSNYYGAHGWWGEFYWNGGPGLAGRSGPLTDAGFAAGGCCSQTNLQSRTIGWFLACNQSSCPTGSAGVGMTVGELDLTAQENQAPSIVAVGANNLWYQSGWVRGTWPVSFTRNRSLRSVRRGRGVRQPAGDSHADAGYRTESAHVAAVSAAERSSADRHDRLRWEPRTRRGRDAAEVHRNEHGESDRKSN